MPMSRGSSPRLETRSARVIFNTAFASRGFVNDKRLARYSLPTTPIMRRRLEVEDGDGDGDGDNIDEDRDGDS